MQEHLIEKSHEAMGHPAKFLGCRSCGSGDIMFLHCHVISEDYLT